MTALRFRAGSLVLLITLLRVLLSFPTWVLNSVAVKATYPETKSTPWPANRVNRETFTDKNQVEAKTKGIQEGVKTSTTHHMSQVLNLT